MGVGCQVCQRAAFEVMTIDANATSMRGKVLFYVKINVQLYDLYHT